MSEPDEFWEGQAKILFHRKLDLEERLTWWRFWCFVFLGLSIVLGVT